MGLCEGSGFYPKAATTTAEDGAAVVERVAAAVAAAVTEGSLWMAYGCGSLLQPVLPPDGMTKWLRLREFVDNHKCGSGLRLLWCLLFNCF